MALTASKLRQDIYRILDQVLETGVPIEIERQGKILKIMPADVKPKLDRLAIRDCIDGDPQELVEIDWSGEWKP